ncbi:MAG: 3-hydroxyacyl-CoA dehydrogenase family protein [Bacteroidales bacterium]|nr:3-hydroxyacyl-CoA dehydrogenase family protein [Bacteroidales bacterium]MBN2757642.1 3-hydroxyacyl-CoA dehydrogenase family protein [Bacteroidales bacterium]
MAELIVEQIEKYALNKSERPKAQFSNVGLVGAGTTGQRIILMMATKGIEVIFLELSKEIIDETFKELAEEMDSRIEHWGMTSGDKRAVLSRIKGTLDYSDFKECDLVIESILSKKRELSVDVRKSVFKKIEDNTRRDAIIATNSTTTVITELSSELNYKDRCLSLHFSTTAPGANVVEVVRGIHTSQAICEDVKKFTTLIDKIAIPVEESPGLISVRLFVSLIGEACDILMENVSSKGNIDLAMKNGLGLPLGPFEMADRIGLDKVVRWMDNLYNEFGDMKYKPSPLLKKLVRANRLGRKTHSGFYIYNEQGRKIDAAENYSKC